MQGFIEFFSKLKARFFFEKSNLKSVFFNPGTDCVSFPELKTILSLKNQHSARIQI